MSQRKSEHSGVNRSWQPGAKLEGNKTVQYYLDGIENDNRTILAEAITLIENVNVPNQKKYEFLAKLKVPTDTLRIAISGAPGVGKSTFINSLGMFLLSQGHRVAVLAVDPSSTITKGSILGDKTRMYELSTAKEAYVRPSPTRSIMGGVTASTKEAITICEAGGYDVIIIETVGVGQTETEVMEFVDFFALLLLPGAGDDLQGIKKGIVEIADIFIINKADGDRIQLAQESKKYYQNALHLVSNHDGQTKSVMVCSALENEKINETWSAIKELQLNRVASGKFLARRKIQEVKWEQKTQDKIFQALSSELYEKTSINQDQITNRYQRMSNFIELAQNFFNQIKLP